MGGPAPVSLAPSAVPPRRQMESLDLSDQLALAEKDRLRVLILGAGVAGTTLAALLRLSGLNPVLVERSAPAVDQGYMLGLVPLVHPVLAALGRAEAYLASSVAVDRYLIRGRHGRPLKEYSLDRLSTGGGYRGITRAALLGLLGQDRFVSHTTTIAALRQGPNRAVAQLHHRGILLSEASFDVVVVAEGMHSATRSLVLGEAEVSGVDTWMAGWIAWVEADADPRRFDELWGDGFFIGTYPVPGRTGVFVGGAEDAVQAGPAAFASGLAGMGMALPPAMAGALDVLASADTRPYRWPLADVRAQRWTAGRIVLLGDAAAGFLPTVGLGAAMAMESAGVLASHLLGARPADVAGRLKAFEKAQRARVEAAQDDSRLLARAMFSSHPRLRDLGVRILPEAMSLRSLRKLLSSGPALNLPTQG